MKTINTPFLAHTRQESYLISRIFSLVIILSMILISCTSTQQAGSTQTAIVSSLYTQAAATFIAEMTVNAPTPTPEPQKVVYSSNKGGNWNLYFTHLGIKDEVPLTSNLGDERYPTWSPDGTKIAYQTNQDGMWQIFVMDANGLNKRQLTTIGNNQHPSWSPDGSKIAFDSDRLGDTYIHTMNSNGDNQVSQNGYPKSTEPAWSPDGSTIAFIAINDIEYPDCGDDCFESVFFMNSFNNVTTWMSEPGWYRSPAWSPDGKKLIYVHAYVEGTMVEEYVVESATVNTAQIGLFRDPLDTRLFMYLNYHSVNFSPDGQNYLVCSTVTAFTMNAAGQEDGPPAYVENCYMKSLNNEAFVQIVQGTEYINPNDDAYYSINDAALQPE
jgi:Tol biopolymer transport system component